MSIQIRQSAEPETSKLWRWSVWLEGDDDELNRIQSVTYQLHSTFTNPIRKITDRQSGFRLDSSGWGQFMIYLTLHHVSGEDEKRQSWLQFGKHAPSKEVGSMFGEKFKDRTPTAFLSFSVADTLIAMAVRNNLTAKGVSVLDVSRLGEGESLNDGIEDMISQSDFGISIISDINSKWANQETLQMQERNIPVIKITADNPENNDKDINVIKTLPLGNPIAAEYAALIDSFISLDKDRH